MNVGCIEQMVVGQVADRAPVSVSLEHSSRERTPVQSLFNQA